MAVSNGTILTFYEGDSGEIHLGRVGEDTTTFQAVVGSDQPRTVGPATSPFWFESSRGNTEYGLRPRKVAVCFETTAPDGLELGVNYPVVVFNKAVYEGIGIRQVVSYQGQEGIVTRKYPESIYPGI